MTLRAWSTILRDFGGVKNTANAAACWEHLVLHGAVPESWLDNPQRIFAYGSTISPQPHTVGLCISLAMRMPRAQQVEERYCQRRAFAFVRDDRPVQWLPFTVTGLSTRELAFDDVSYPDLWVGFTAENVRGDYTLRFPRSPLFTAMGGFVDDLRWPSDPKHAAALTYAEAAAHEAKVRRERAPVVAGIAAARMAAAERNEPTEPR